MGNPKSHHVIISILGDVDSGDDNESERHSNNSSKSQMNQNTPDICPKQTFNVISSETPLKYSNGKQQHSTCEQQPTNQTCGTIQPDNPSNAMSSMENQETLLSCQNVSVYGMGINSVASQNSDFVNASMKVDDNHHMPKNSTGDKQIAFDNGNRYGQCYANERQPFCAGVSPAHGRQLRNRMYGITKPGMVKHETKL